MLTEMRSLFVWAGMVWCTPMLYNVHFSTYYWKCNKFMSP